MRGAAKETRHGWPVLPCRKITREVGLLSFVRSPPPPFAPILFGLSTDRWVLWVLALNPVL
jgi:hypothetical protein